METFLIYCLGLITKFQQPYKRLYKYLGSQLFLHLTFIYNNKEKIRLAYLWYGPTFLCPPTVLSVEIDLPMIYSINTCLFEVIFCQNINGICTFSSHDLSSFPIKFTKLNQVSIVMVSKASWLDYQICKMKFEVKTKI